jgi:glycosyltransferase involved in cell wall biosynthesis
VLSVIVPVFRNSNLVEYALDSALRDLPDSAELIVVDDASGLDTQAILQRFSRVRVVTHPANRGNTVAYNTGARAAAGDVLIFMDSDILVPSGGLVRLAEFCRTHAPAVGAVGTLLTYPQNYTVQHAGVALDRWVATHVYAGSSPSGLGLEAVEDRQAVTAALMACSRTVFERVGGFDETYRDGMEDIDFCLKCGEAGLRNVLYSDVRAMHLESATRGPYKQVRRTYNYSIFFSRWSGRYQPDLVPYLRRSLGRIDRAALDAGPVTVVNFCTSPSWLDLVSEVGAQGAELGPIHDQSGFVAEGEAIDLFRHVPLALHRSPSSLLFVVDRVGQLAGNRHWFDCRLARDLLVDRHANAVLSAPANARS